MLLSVCLGLNSEHIHNYTIILTNWKLIKWFDNSDVFWSNFKKIFCNSAYPYSFNEKSDRFSRPNILITNPLDENHHVIHANVHYFVSPNEYTVHRNVSYRLHADERLPIFNMIQSSGRHNIPQMNYFRQSPISSVGGWVMLHSWKGLRPILLTLSLLVHRRVGLPISSCK